MLLRDPFGTSWETKAFGFRERRYVKKHQKRENQQIVLLPVFLQVKLLAGAKFLDQGTYPVKTTVLDGDVPISTDDCGKY